MIICKKCNSIENIEEHHIHPRFMDNLKGYGIKIYLCKKCHTILHFKIPSIIWKYIKNKDKLKIIKEIENYSLDYYCTEYKNKKINEVIKEERCPHCDREIDEEDTQTETGIIKCPYCSESINVGDINDKYT